MAVNRKRETILAEVDTIDLEYETLDSAIEILQRLAKAYGGDASIYREQYAYSDGYYFAVKANRLETDEEMKIRIAQEERWAADQEARERAEFQRLSAKFGEKD